MVRKPFSPSFSKIKEIDLNGNDGNSLDTVNSKLGLALADKEIEYLKKLFPSTGRNPTDAELMMFAQVNSEHCRHKIFNGCWTLDGESQEKSPFEIIKNTTENNLNLVLSAYDDNAAVLKGYETYSFRVDPTSKKYIF